MIITKNVMNMSLNTNQKNKNKMEKKEINIEMNTTTKLITTSVSVHQVQLHCLKNITINSFADSPNKKIKINK